MKSNTAIKGAGIWWRLIRHREYAKNAEQHENQMEKDAFRSNKVGLFVSFTKDR